MNLGNGIFVAIVAIILSSAAQAYPPVPDPQMTTGELCSHEDPDYQGRRYPERIEICRRDVDGELKRKIYRAYGIPDQCRRRYTIDHFIPLSIGGNNSIRNLWPEHKLVKAKRFDLEQEIFNEVSAGRMTQSMAVEKIRQAKMRPSFVTSGASCD